MRHFQIKTGHLLFLKLQLVALSQMSGVKLSDLHYVFFTPLSIFCLLSVQVQVLVVATLLSSRLSAKCPREASSSLQLPHLSHLAK